MLYKIRKESQESVLSDQENKLAEAVLNTSYKAGVRKAKKRVSVIQKATTAPHFSPTRNKKFRFFSKNEKKEEKKPTENHGESDRTEFQIDLIHQVSKDFTLLEKKAKDRDLNSQEQDRLKRLKEESQIMNEQYQSSEPPKYPPTLKNAQYPRMEIFFSCKNFTLDKTNGPYFLKISCDEHAVTSKRLIPTQVHDSIHSNSAGTTIPTPFEIEFIFHKS